MPVDEKLLAAVKHHQDMQNSIRQSIRQNLFADLSDAAYAIIGAQTIDLSELHIIVPPNNQVTVMARSAQAILSIIATLSWDEI